MATDQDPGYLDEAPPVQRVRLLIASARSALQHARRILGPEHEAAEDLDAALLLLTIVTDDLAQGER